MRESFRQLYAALERINYLATVELNGTDRQYYVTNRGDIAAESRKALTDIPVDDFWREQYLQLSKEICEACGTPTDTFDSKYIGTQRLLQQIKEQSAVLEVLAKFWGDDGQCDAPIWPGAYLAENDEPIRDVVRRAVGWRKP